jgi:ferredoxin
VRPQPVPRELEEHARRAVDACPVLALKLARARATSG